MTFFWPWLADSIGIVAHAIACVCAAYLAYWCFRAWLNTRQKIAAGAGWLMTVLSLMSAYRLSDFVIAADSGANCIVVEFGAWTRIGLAVTLAYVAAQVWKAGRGRE